jgi:transcriptional regulator with XRE-family HTH domain
MSRRRAGDGPHPVDVHVGQRLRLRRVLLGLSQQRLGECLGVSFQQVQKYEKGTNRVAASRLHEFAQVMDVPVGFFFEGLPAFSGKVPTEVRHDPLPGCGRTPATDRIAEHDRGRPETMTHAPHPIDIQVGNHIRIRRRLLGLTQRDLARHLGLTFQQIQHYESGANRISASRLHDIATLLDLPVACFFEEDPAPLIPRANQHRHSAQPRPPVHGRSG